MIKKSNRCNIIDRTTSYFLPNVGIAKDGINEAFNLAKKNFDIPVKIKVKTRRNFFNFYKNLYNNRKNKKKLLDNNFFSDFIIDIPSSVFKKTLINNRKCKL